MIRKTPYYIVPYPSIRTNTLIHTWLRSGVGFVQISTLAESFVREIRQLGVCDVCTLERGDVANDLGLP